MKTVFRKIVGIVATLPKLLIEFGPLVDMLKGMIEIAVADRDVPKLRLAVQYLRNLGESLVRLGAEIIEAADAGEQALSDTGDGGNNLTGHEIEEIMDELDDVPDALVDAGKIAADLAVKIREAL